MKSIKYYISVNGEIIEVFGNVISPKKVELIYNNVSLGVINSHKDDLDTVEKEFKKLIRNINLKSIGVTENKGVSPSDVIKGLEEIITKYPETKSRLASLKSQVYNVLKKNNVLD